MSPVGFYPYDMRYVHQFDIPPQDVPSGVRSKRPVSSNYNLLSLVSVGIFYTSAVEVPWSFHPLL
jgi:hypothetical protein